MKKTKYVIVGILSTFLIWYFLIKQYDYLVRFEIKTSPGNVYKSLEEFNLANSQMDSFAYVINHKIPFSRINEDITIKNDTINFDWKFNSVNDSITLVKVGLTESQNTLFNRLTVPFAMTKFKKTALNVIKDFEKGMRFQLKNKLKVKILGNDTIPQVTYAYIDIKNIKMEDKASEMIKNNSVLITFVRDHDLKNGDFPFVIINDWNLKEETISFRYCFPIVAKDTLPVDKEIKYGKIQPIPALKAIYNGNYKTSDRGWFALHEYAKNHEIGIEEKPIEFYHNNPFYGGDELKWITEVYMPLKEQHTNSNKN